MSDRWITFNPVLPTPLLLGGLICLAIIFLWAEQRRAMRYRMARIIAVAILMVSLGALLLRPSYRTTISNTIILLTAGYDPGKTDSLLDVEPGAMLMHTGEAKPYKNSRLLGSFHDLSDHKDEVRYILGQGLSRDALDVLQHTNYGFIPSPYPSGITALRVQRPVLPERSNTIEGVFNHAPAGEKLYLSGPGGKEDSVMLAGKANELFSLTFTPKQPGAFLYTLTGSKGLNESLPVYVEQQQSSAILFIQHFPTFESRSLKNFLGEDHSILFRYQLSQHKYRYEFINRKPQSLDKLTTGTLAAFDLMIIDSDALQSLSSSELGDVKKSVSEGMGLLILLNDVPSKIKRIQTFLPEVFVPYSSDTAQVRIKAKKITLPSWAFKVNPDAGIVPTLKNRIRILSGYRYDGFGKTGFQLLQETYRLMLEGDSLAYSALWSDLVGKTARAKKDPFSVRIGDEFPLYPDQPLMADVIAGGADPVLLNDGVRIPLIEDLFIDDVWKGKLWAGRQGWHTLTPAGDSTGVKYYVSDRNNWASLAAANAIARTSQHSVKKLPEKELTAVFKPVPMWLFYLLFLFSAGFLWLVPKL
jgi:hypothetical protein